MFLVLVWQKNSLKYNIKVLLSSSAGDYSPKILYIDIAAQVKANIL